MAESDSDLEIIEELPSQREITPRKYAFDAASDDDELLDLDYNDDIVVSKTSGSSFGRRSKSKKNSNKIAEKMPPKRKEVPQIVLSDDDDYEDMEKKSDRGSDATDVIDDDLESLPSIPPPSPPPTSSSQKAANANGRKYGLMDVDSDSDPYPLHPCSSSSTATTITRTTGSSKGSSQNSFFADLEAQEVDKLFQDAEYASLADFLAETERKKTKKSTSTSKPFSFDKKAGKSPSKGIPSFSDFACRQEETLTAPKSKVRTNKPAAKTRSTEEIVNEIQESYQVNKKSSNRSKAKKKDKENPALSAGTTSGCSSASSLRVPTSSDDSQGQGKLKKPKDPLKMIVLHVAANVLTDELASKLIEKEIQFQIVDSPVIPDSILFEHNVPYKMAGKDGQISEKVHKEVDANIAIIFRIDQHLELLQGELDRDCDSEPSSKPSQTLSEWIQNINKKHPGKKITLLMHGLDAYLRKLQRAVQKEYRDRVLKADKPDNGKKKRKANSQQGINLTRFEVQNALISAQLETNMHYRLYETNADLALLLSQYAKSIGEAPYKLEKMKSTDFDWYAVADAVGGIPVDENGQGMRSLWIAQLTQFPGVGQESALAIARVYGCPKVLYQAYRRCKTVQEGKDLLANIQVTMGVGPLAKSRRLGPEASKKIYRFFTSTDGERELHV